MHHLSLSLAFAGSMLLLTGCKPQGPEAADPFSQHHEDTLKSQKGERIVFTPPPEIARTLKLDTADERAEVVFLQANGSRAYAARQKAVLAFQTGTQKGYKLTVLDAAGSTTKQRDQLREAFASKTRPAAIILDAESATGLETLLDETRRAGIHVIGLDKALTGCSTIVACDPEEIGRAAAKLTIDALKRKAAEEGRPEPTGRIVQLRGADDSSWSTRLAAGFDHGLKAASGPILVHDAPVLWSADNAIQRLSEALRIQSQFDVIFAHTDAIALGASRFCTTYNTREDTLIVGVDGLSGRGEGLDLMRAGDLDATIARPPLVDLALQLILKMRADPAFKPKPLYDIAPMAVTPSNLDTANNSGTYRLPEL